MMNPNEKKEKSRNENFAVFCTKSLTLFFIGLAVVLSLAGCSTMKAGLQTGPVIAGDVKGTFNVVFLGANFANDFETIAFLDVVGDGYEIEPYAPAFRYRVKKDVPAQDALAEAEKFAGQITGFHKVQYSKILDPNNKVIGYEVRPLYYPHTFGVDDVLDVFYRIKDNKVMVEVTLKPTVKQMIEGDRQPRIKGKD